MSFWASVGRAAKVALQTIAATEGAPASALPAPGAVIGAIAGSKITFGQLVTTAKAIEGSGLGAHLAGLIASLGDVDNDFDVTIELARALSPILPLAGDVAIAAEVLKFGFDIAKTLPAATWAPAPRGGPPIAEADWSHGPPQPQSVDNPSGSIGG